MSLEPPSPAHSTDPREVEVIRPHLPKAPPEAYPEELRDTADEDRSHDPSLAGAEGREEIAKSQYSDAGTLNSPSDLTGQVTRSSNHPFASGGFGDIYKGSFNMRGRLIDVRHRVFCIGETKQSLGCNQDNQGVLAAGPTSVQEAKGILHILFVKQT